MEEMNSLARKAVRDNLSASSRWTLPLSGGLDSRFLAVVAAESGLEVRAFTFGSKNWYETIYARQVAQKLGLPWREVDLGNNFLRDHLMEWADWFGSSMHFHGMYQFPY